MNYAMNGYEPIFQAAKSDAAASSLQEEIERFRSSNLFHFTVPVHGMRFMPDHEALGIAVMHDPQFVLDCLRKPKPTLGYANPADFCAVDMIDSRHIMMIAILKQWLPTTDLRIVEIGGGFGNWARLCEGQIDYRTWTIIDMRFVSSLQDLFLRAFLQDFGKIALIDTDQYPAWKTQCERFDLAIGAHSMSEFGFPDFYDYFEHVVMKSKYFFYATHLSYPEPIMVREKLAKIEQHFHCMVMIKSEQDSVGNYLFVNNRL